MKYVFYATVMTTLPLIGCESGDTSSSSRFSYSESPNYIAGDGSSHNLQITDQYVSRYGVLNDDSLSIHALAYADFDQDGDTDIFMAPLDSSENTTPFRLYLNNGSNHFSQSSSFFDGNAPGLVHARKALPGDFNGDGKMDIFVLGHGYDQPPFPGETPILVLSTDDGFEQATLPDNVDGFNHGGASADIDHDGDLDIFVINNDTGSYLLINDGSGNFSKDDGSIFTPTVYGFTTELVDVDQDGYIDILVAGHEHEGMASRIFWGSSSGTYSTSDMTELPEVGSYRVVVDIDVADLDNDGNRDLLLTRTGDGAADSTQTFYQGYYLQLLINDGMRGFEDKTATQLSTGHSSSDSWFDWLRLQDFNADGQVDIMVDDAARKLVWLNDGHGYFSKN